MNFRVLEPAQHELDEAILYYNSQVAGLGDAFLLEVVAAIETIPDATAGLKLLQRHLSR